MDRTGKIIGMTVFAIGIIVLMVVFAVAYSMFTASWAQLMGAPGGSGHVTANELGNGLAAILVKVVLLFVMTIVGSMVASRGIRLYLGSGGYGTSKRGPSKATKQKAESDLDA